MLIPDIPQRNFDSQSQGEYLLNPLQRKKPVKVFALKFRCLNFHCNYSYLRKMNNKKNLRIKNICIIK